MQNSLRNFSKKKFATIPNALILDSSLTDRARFVFCLIASQPNDYFFYPSVLAKALGYSLETLKKYFNELIENGWIVQLPQPKWKKGQFMPNRFRLKELDKFFNCNKLSNSK